MSKQLANKPPRVVPAFSYQSIQKNTVVQKPPKTDALKLASSNVKSEIKTKSSLRSAHQRNDLPVRINHAGSYPKIEWTVQFDQIDYDKWLPIFIDGLKETQFPYNLMAQHGSLELIENGDKTKVLRCLPYCIAPLKEALRSKRLDQMCVGMKVIQKIATDVEYGGQALVPYYRQLLPPLGTFMFKNVNIGDHVEFGQQKGRNLGDLIEETLRILERTGGDDALVNIQYVIPTYQSFMKN